MQNWLNSIFILEWIRIDPSYQHPKKRSRDQSCGCCKGSQALLSHANDKGKPWTMPDMAWDCRCEVFAQPFWENCLTSCWYVISLTVTECIRCYSRVSTVVSPWVWVGDALQQSSSSNKSETDRNAWCLDLQMVSNMWCVEDGEKGERLESLKRFCWPSLQKTSILEQLEPIQRKYVVLGAALRPFDPRTIRNVSPKFPTICSSRCTGWTAAWPYTVLGESTGKTPCRKY